MKQIKIIALLFVAAIVLQACYPGDSIPIEDLDTTSTFYESDDFITPHTSAAIMWDVVEVVDDNDPDNNIPYDGEVDSEILNTTLDNMVALYGEANVTIISETDIPSPSVNNTYPDVRIVTPNDPTPMVEALFAPSIVLKKKTIVYTYPGYPWYGGGWGCWYCSPCYYCGYPPTVGYSSYETGTVTLDMINVNEISAGPISPNDSPLSWVAISRGLISSNEAFNAERVENGINQAFIQSPYLAPKN